MVSRNAKIAAAIVIGGTIASAAVIFAKRAKAVGFNGTMTIHVENADTLALIAGATVTYGGLTVTTDANGNAKFTGAPASGNLAVTATGFTSYGPTPFTPTGSGPYFVPMSPTGGGILYSQSLLLIASSQSAALVTANFHNQNTIPIQVIAYCTVKNAVGQTVSLGQSAAQAVSPGSTALFTISLSPTLPSGSYTFHFFATDTIGRPVSGDNAVTASV